MKASAIIVAAGSGTRLGHDLPKAFVELGGQTLLGRALRTVGALAEIEEAVVTVPAGMESRARAEVHTSGLEIPVKITAGGVERQDSVRIALGLTSAEAELIAVHDAARPFATPAMYSAVLAAAQRHGGAIVGIPVADTLKHADQSGAIIATVARAALWQAQTPQAFRRALLVRAHERAAAERITATDDADLVERLGATVMTVAGTGLNFKITTAADLRLAELVAASGSLF